MKRSIGLDYLFTITLFAPKLNIVGDTPLGKRILINVDGGHFDGPKIKGTIKSPAGDWLLVRADNSVQLDVRLSMLTDDETLVYMSYQGLRTAKQSVLDRLAAGDDVDPSEYYMRIVSKFETEAGRYGWLNNILAIGTGQRLPDKVIYDIHQIT